MNCGYISAVHIESFHIHYTISLLSWENMNSQVTSLPMCGFIAQLVEHRTGIAEVTGSNPVEVLIFLFFFQASLFQLLKLEIHCEDHISPSINILEEQFNFPLSEGFDWSASASTPYSFNLDCVQYIRGCTFVTSDKKTFKHLITQLQQY